MKRLIAVAFLVLYAICLPLSSAYAAKVMSLTEANFKKDNHGIILKAFSNKGEFFTEPNNKAKEQISLDFIQNNYKVLGIAQSGVGVAVSKKTRFGNLTKIVYSRYYKGIEIIGSEVIVNMDNEGRIFEVVNNYQGEIDGLNVNPKMSSNDCGEVVKNSMGLSKSSKIKSELRLFNDGNNYFLVWRMFVKDNKSEFIAVVDANTGKILKKRSLRIN